MTPNVVLVTGVGGSLGGNLAARLAANPAIERVLSVDTALMHLAAAMKVPNQIVIEAPTLNPTNVPWGNAYRLIRNPVVDGRNLAYYRYDGRPIRGSEEELLRCMASITVDEVHRVVEQALGSG